MEFVGLARLLVTAGGLFALARERIDDLLAVESAVLDENLAGETSANNHSGQMNPGNVAFQRVRVKRRLTRFRVEASRQGFR